MSFDRPPLDKKETQELPKTIAECHEVIKELKKNEMTTFRFIRYSISLVALTISSMQILEKSTSEPEDYTMLKDKVISASNTLTTYEGFVQEAALFNDLNAQAFGDSGRIAQAEEVAGKLDSLEKTLKLDIDSLSAEVERISQSEDK